MEDKKRNIRCGITAGTAALFAAAVLILYRLSFAAPERVERVYSRGIFPVLSSVLYFLFGWTGISAGELLLYLTLLCVISILIGMTVNLIRKKKDRIGVALRTFLTLVTMAAVLLSSFCVLWGFNYARQPLAQTLELTTSPASVKTLEEVCGYLTERANTLREELPQDESGVIVLSKDRMELLEGIPDMWNAAAGQTGIAFATADFSHPKRVLWSEGLSWSGIGGVYFPFTGEANVNYGMPNVSFISCALHETSHQAGFAREDECEFLAYYLSARSGSAEAEYSGTVNALIHCMNALYDADTDSYADVRAGYSDALSRDVRSINLYWDAYEGETQEAMNAMNDNYLKANAQDEGVKSYGRMVDLVIADYLQNIA